MRTVSPSSAGRLVVAAAVADVGDRAWRRVSIEFEAPVGDAELASVDGVVESSAWGVASRSGSYHTLPAVLARVHRPAATSKSFFRIQTNAHTASNGSDTIPTLGRKVSYAKGNVNDRSRSCLGCRCNPEFQQRPDAHWYSLPPAGGDYQVHPS